MTLDDDLAAAPKARVRALRDHRATIEEQPERRSCAVGTMAETMGGDVHVASNGFNSE